MYLRLKNDIKESMLNKDKDRKDVLKQVQIHVQSYIKENKLDVVSDDIVLNAVMKELKQLNQTKDALRGKEDSDLYKSTEYKIGVLQTYLPKQLTKEECLAEVQRLVESITSEPKGKIIGMMMKSLKGKADNRLIKECIDEILG